MNPKLAKQIAKLALMALGSITIGTIIKVEKNLEKKLDDHYATPVPETPQDD